MFKCNFSDSLSVTSLTEYDVWLCILCSGFVYVRFFMKTMPPWHKTYIQFHPSVILLFIMQQLQVFQQLFMASHNWSSLQVLKFVSIYHHEFCIANNHESPHYKPSSHHKTNLIFSLSLTTHIKKPLGQAQHHQCLPTEHVAFAILKLTFDINND